jgi:hypothetical protein
MNALSQLWLDVVAELNANKAMLGIDGAERASSGQVITLSPPACAVWLKLGGEKIMTTRGAVNVPVDVIIFCVASPDDAESEAVDKALEIAVKVYKLLSYATVGGVLLSEPSGEPAIDVVQKTSNAAIAAVLLQAKVSV